MAIEMQDFNGPLQQTQPVKIVDNDEQRDLKLAKELMSQGKAARQPWDKDWSKQKDYYLGKQWSGEEGSYRSKPVMNIIAQTIAATIPILTDNRPGFSVIPKEPSDFEFSLILSELVSAYWENHSMDQELLSCIMDSMIYDIGILKITWDQKLEDGIGDIKIETIDPSCVYFNYGATDFTQERGCKWVIHKTDKCVSDLKVMFPDKAEDIKSDSNKKEDSKSPSDDIKLISPTDQYSPPGMQGSSSSQPDQRKTAEVWELWIYDDIYDEVETPDGKAQKNKYPRGRLITLLPNQNIILQAVENPYSHAKFPFVKLIDNLLPREMVGMGESRSLMQTQRMLNRVLAHIFDYFNLMSNPVWVVEDDSGVDPATITNSIAQIIRTNPGGMGKIRRDFAPSVQSGIFDLYNLMVRQSEMISGITEVSQARNLYQSQMSGAAIESLQESSQTRIRLKERNLQTCLQQMGSQVIALMMQYYREPRVARITGKSEWPSYFEFFIEEPETGKYKINKKGYNYNEQSKQYVPDNQYTSSAQTKGMMDVKILSGTSLPWNKASRANIAFRLYDSKAIDTQELLTALEWPNADKIAQRLAQSPEVVQQQPTGV